MKFYKKTYVCDPDKCKDCEKTSCQSLCFRTTKKESRAMGLKLLKHWIGEKKAGKA